jgi:hypothetical protein
LGISNAGSFFGLLNGLAHGQSWDYVEFAERLAAFSSPTGLGVGLIVGLEFLLRRGRATQARAISVRAGKTAVLAVRRTQVEQPRILRLNGAEDRDQLAAVSSDRRSFSSTASSRPKGASRSVQPAEVRNTAASNEVPPICSGPLDRRAQVNLCNLLRSETPTCVFERKLLTRAWPVREMRNREPD